MNDATQAADTEVRNRNESIDTAGITRAVLLIAFGALVFLLATTKMWDPDVGWHLRIGEYIIRTKSLLFEDIYSWTRPGARWYDTEWLFNAAMYLTYVKWGVVGVILGKAAIVTAGALALFFALEEACGNYLVALAVTDIAVTLIRFRFTERPQIFSYLFMPLLLLILLRFQNGKKSPLWLIPPLIVLWVNLHAGAALGAAVVVLFFTGELAKSALKRWGVTKADPIPWPKLRPLAIISGLGLAGLLVTPITYHLFEYIVRFTPYSAGRITEHAPMSLAGFPAETTYAWIVIALALVAILNLETWWLLLAVVFGAAAFTANRFIADFVIVTAPMASVRLRELLRFGRACLEGGWRRKIPAWTSVGLAVAFLTVMASQAWLMSISPWNGPAEQFGLGVYERSPFYPIYGVKFLNRHDIQGRMFNTFAFGGYFIWHEWPKRRVFFDGRLPIYQSVLAEWHKVTRRSELRRFMDRHGVDFCLVQNQRDIHSTLQFDKRDWALVFWDDVALLYVTRTPAHAKLIERYEYRYARPYLTDDYTKLSKKDAMKTLVELSRAVRESPISTYPHLARAQILLSHDEVIAGVSEVLQAQKLDPSSSDGELVMGLYLMGRGSRYQALQKFRNLGAAQ